MHGLGRRIQAALIRHDEFEYSRLRRVELQTRKLSGITGDIYRHVHRVFAFESGTA